MRKLRSRPADLDHLWLATVVIACERLYTPLGLMTSRFLQREFRRSAQRLDLRPTAIRVIDDDKLKDGMCWKEDNITKALK